MAKERRSRFKDSVRTSIRKHDEAIAAVSAVEEEVEPVKPEAEKPQEAVVEVESAPTPQAEEPKGEGSAPAEEEAPVQAPVGEGSAEPKAPKKKSAKPKAAPKPKKEEPEAVKQEEDPFAKAEGKEIKSKRVNLLLKESDYAAWTEAAKGKGVSFTVFVETIVNSYLNR